MSAGVRVSPAAMMRVARAGARSADLEDLVSTPALRAARLFSEPEGDNPYSCRCVVLAGRPGCGKTVALRKALQRLRRYEEEHDLRNEIRFYSFPELSTLLLDPDERNDTLRALREADELILDDVGAGHLPAKGGFVVACFEDMIVHREEHHYPVLMSTNLSPQRFRQVFGERVYDRLKGPWGAWISVDGPSLRRKRAKR